MKLELVSFKICPFVQRAVITLLLKEIPHTITYIDLSSPPDWFKQLSPFGKVPILRVDDSNIIFESAIIDEFLEEICPGSLLPKAPLERAIDRSWIDFGSNLLMDFSGLIHSTDADKFNQKLEIVKKEMILLENKLGPGPYFNGDSFSLVDIAYAPLFMRIDLLNLTEKLCPPGDFPSLSNWSKNLLDIPALSKSVVENFNELLKTHIKNKAPYAATQLNL